MNAAQKRFEKQVIRKRNRLEKKGQRMAYRALLAQIPVEIYTVDGAVRQMESVNDEPIKAFFKKYYGMAGKEIGMMYFQFMQKKDEFLENVFLAEMERYALEEAGYRIVEITKTTRELLISATREAVFQANSQGLGVEKTKNLILEYCRDAIKPSRARAIAQTELITASNRASFAAADKTGLTFKKFWSTSGLPNIRPSHLQAEFDSIGGISMDQPFSNGLMFPGDPEASRDRPEEVVGCRCSAIFLPVS
jgi:hypothetical protein